MNSENNKLDFDDILKKASQGGGISGNSNIERLLNSGLTQTQLNKLNEVLADEGKTKAILESDKAKELFNKLTGGNKDG